MESICSKCSSIPNLATLSEVPLDLQRVGDDLLLGNTPLWFGEWGLPTQFQATDDFLHQWADAQKLAYSKGKGWIVCGFRSSIPIVLLTGCVSSGISGLRSPTVLEISHDSGEYHIL